VCDLLDGAVGCAVENRVEETDLVYNQVFVAVADVVGLLGEDEGTCCDELGDRAAEGEGETGNACPDGSEVG
jgi:hypothetical protein